MGFLRPPQLNQLHYLQQTSLFNEAFPSARKGCTNTEHVWMKFTRKRPPTCTKRNRANKVMSQTSGCFMTAIFSRFTALWVWQSNLLATFIAPLQLATLNRWHVVNAWFYAHTNLVMSDVTKGHAGPLVRVQKQQRLRLKTRCYICRYLLFMGFHHWIC